MDNLHYRRLLVGFHKQIYPVVLLTAFIAYIGTIHNILKQNCPKTSSPPSPKQPRLPDDVLLQLGLREVDDMQNDLPHGYGDGDPDKHAGDEDLLVALVEPVLYRAEQEHGDEHKDGEGVEDDGERPDPQPPA